MSTSTINQAGSTIMSPAAKPVEITFKNHRVINGVVQPNVHAFTRFMNESSTITSAAQAEYDAHVEAEQLNAQARGSEWPVWKQVALFVPYTLPAFILSSIVDGFNKICAFLGYGNKEVVSVTTPNADVKVEVKN
jgi:hypothetical protein